MNRNMDDLRAWYRQGLAARIAPTSLQSRVKRILSAHAAP